jgi:gliding motility-associated-like protein
MQVVLKDLNKYLRSKNSIQLFILLTVCEILNLQASILTAEELHAHPGSIVFNAVQGHSLSDTRSIFIFTSLGTTINWSQSKDVSWLTPDLQNGVTDGILKIGVNITGKQPGIYYGNITIQSPQSSAGPVIVSVTLVINPDVPVKITTWRDGHNGAMSVCVDDSKSSGFDELQANGFKGTYVLEGVSPPSFYTDYYNAGMELGSHTVDHPCYAVSDDVLRTQEIEPNILALCTNTPEPCKDVISFVWPCGFTNYREQAVASEYFLSARGYNINQLEDATPDNFMNLKSYNSHESTPYPPSDLKTVVDAAVDQQKWFNLVLHDYTNDDGAISYANSKDIWVNSIGTVIKYILQRDRFILTNYNASYDRITYNVSRLQIPSSVSKNFEDAFGPNDVITMQIDIDDSKTVENVFINGVSNPYQTKNLNGNIVLFTNVSLASSLTKTVEIKYHVTTIGLTITGVTANNKVYNGTTAATLNTGSATLVGVVPGDVVTLVSAGATGTFVNKNVGTGKTVSTSGFTLGGTDAGNYTLTQPSLFANITTANLAISGVTANNKVYDGTTTATLNTGNAALVGVFGSDVVTLISTGATGTFADANIATAKIVYTSGFTFGGTDSGNYTLTQPTTTANITGIILTVTGVTANNKVYDGTTAATLNTGSASLVGIIGGDIVTLVSTGATGTFANKNVGTGKTVSTSGFALGGSDAGKYTLTQPITTANITKAGLTISGVIANNKVYNRTTTATLNTGSATFLGVSGTDVVTLNSTGATGTFADKNVGTGKAVSISGFTLGGADAGNYSLAQPSSTANITTAGLTVSGVTANNKVYDGTTTATLNTGSATLAGVFGTDVVTLITTGASGTFSDANIGTAKVVSTSGFAIGGTDSGNYILIQPTTTADITGIVITVTGVTANNKVYDGTTAATLNTGSTALVGVIGSEVVNLVSTGATGTFSNKNAGTGKTVSTSGFTLGGTDAGKYTLTQPTTVANITKADLTISGVIANNKVYNRTTIATLNSGSATLAGVFGTDVVVLVSTGATGTFTDKNVGTGKPVSISGFTLGGTDSGNYTLAQPVSTADITTASLTVSGVTANNKVYDGTTSATLNTGSAVLVGVFGGDIVSFISSGGTGTFSNANVGIAKVVSISSFTLGGTDADNYTLTQPTTTADITGIALTVIGVTANNKVYDGITNAILNTGSAVLVDVVPGDVVNLVSTGATGAFVNKNVGSGKSVSTSGFTLGGTDAGKYSLTQPTTTANITSTGLTISGVSTNNKVYNGTTVATLNNGSASIVGVMAGDVVTLISAGATGIFTDKNVGTGKAVVTSGFTLSGTDAGNYTLTQPSSSANITTASLTISGITANNKMYDGTTAVTLNTGSAALVGVFGTDVVTLISTSATGTFANKNVGTGKSVSISGFTLGGTDVANYTLIEPIVVANITRAVLTLSGVTANNKVYNGTTVAILNTGSASLVGVLGGGDVVNLISTGATGTFANKNVGTGISVSTSGFTLGGTDADNYNLTQPSSTANITTAGLTVSGITANKVYDGTTAVILNTGSASLVGVFGTDVVTLVSTGATGTFVNKNVGSGKAVSTSGFTLGGTDAGNYTLTQPALIADLSPKALTITANDFIKHYNTTLTFTGNEFTAEGLVPGDAVPSVTINSLGAPASADVGKYTISIEEGADDNYNFTYVSGILTVGKSALIVMANNKTKVYGSENPELSITYSGFFKNEDASVLDVNPVVTTTALNTSNAGSYAITLSGGSDNNYDLTLVNGSLEIVKAPLTITAEDNTKVYGGVNPDLTITYSGFVLGQDQSVLDVLPVAETDANLDSDAGNYDIGVSGAADKNYSFIYNKGTLNLKKADQEITFADISAGLRMTQSYNLSATASSGLDVSFEVSDPGIASLNGNILTVKKDGNLTITAKQEGDQNWDPAPAITHSIETLPTFNGISSLFTPNNDGMNDYWYIPDLEQYDKLQVTVYNRFGQAVYKSDSYKNDWDGTWNGYPLPSASYYYIIKSSTKGFIKGVVNIVR